MRSALFLIFLSIAIFNSGCATNMLRQFELVQVGMDKDQVLALMESPDRNQRWKGQDRWTYIIYQDQQKHLRQIHFENGTAVYVGEPPQPEISAAAKDQQNEIQNRELEAISQKTKDENQKAFHHYEKDVRGSDQIRYVPQFTPVQ